MYSSLGCSLSQMVPTNARASVPSSYHSLIHLKIQKPHRGSLQGLLWRWGLHRIHLICKMKRRVKCGGWPCRQGDRERRKRLNVHDFMDREKFSKFSLQVGFVNFMLCQLFSCYSNWKIKRSIHLIKPTWRRIWRVFSLSMRSQTLSPFFFSLSPCRHRPSSTLEVTDNPLKHKLSGIKELPFCPFFLLDSGPLGSFLLTVPRLSLSD